MVVIKIHNRNNYNDVIPLVLEDNMCFCTHKLNGADTLEFEIQRQNSNYIYIQEEVKVECFDNRFIIKQIDEHSDFVTVMCDLDFDEWRSDVFVKYRRTNVNIITVMEEIVPQGWHITYGQGVDLTKRTTVEQSQGEAFRAATSYDILDAVRKAFAVEFSFDVIGKVIGVININSYTSSGEYFMEELNMTDLGFNGDSTEFATRVYAYGKRDEDTDEYITFADINDGKEYVEDKTYVDKVVSYVLIDERYTVKEHLLEYARTVLSEKCKPVRSYECSVINFNNDMYLYKIVTIVDKTRKLRIEHQCVEYVEYKDNRLDKVTLSTLAPSFERIVKSVDSQIQEQISSATSGIQDLINSSIDRVTDAIVGNNGGYFRWIFDSDGRPIELVNLYDSMDLDTAQKVWRWNAGGLGHSNNGYNGTYSLALTKDGEINASMITTGILNADVIKAGTISDVAGKNYWNLETGEFRLSTMPTINLLPSIYRREFMNPETTTSAGWTSEGVKWTVDALGRVTGSGTATADNSYFLITANNNTDPIPRITLDPAKSYFLQGGPAGGSQEGYSLRAQAYDASENVINTYADYGDGVVIPAGATYLYVWIRFMSGTSTTKRFWPMLSEGTTRKAYQSTHGAEGQMNASIKVNADGITAEVTNRQSADTSLQSQITQNAGQIALKVNTSDYTATNIVNKINGSSLTIDPDNISLVGKTINLTSENVQIISTSGMNVSKDGSIWTGEMKPNKSYASITPDGVLFSRYWLGRGDTPVGQRVLLSSGVIYLQKGEASGTWTDPTTYTGPYTWTTVSTYGLTPDSTDPYTLVSQVNITNITAGDIATGKLLTTGQARLFNSSGIWRANATPQFWFWRSDSTTQANTLALIFANTQTVNSKACMERFYIREYSYDASTGDQKNNWENYYLPTVNAGRTTNASYQILTTKTVGKNTVTYSATVNFAANETKNITLTGTLPSGYAVTDVAGIIAQNTGDGNVVFITVSQPNAATSMGVTCRNFSNSAANNRTVSVTYRLIKGL